MYLFAYKKDKKSVTRQYLKNISYAIVPSMITYASLRTQIRYKYRQMSKLYIRHCTEKFGNRVFLLLVLLQSKSHCFPDHKIEMFLWCHRHRHASMSYVLVRRLRLRELHLIARKLLL